MKETRVCFGEMELLQNRRMSYDDRQVLETKDVSKDPKKAVVTKHTTGVGGGGEYFSAKGDKPCFLLDIDSEN